MWIPFSLGNLPAKFRYPQKEQNCPAVLMVHGFDSNKEGDGQMLELLAERLLQANIAVLQVDFCSCGDNPASKKEYCLTRLEQEVKAAFQWLLQQPMVQKDHCGIIAHSLGARVTSLVSNQLPISFLVFLNGALGDKYRTPWFLKEELYRIEEECKIQGYSNMIKGDGKTITLYQQFMLDLESSCPDDCLKQYQNSILIVYGEQDPTVDPRVSQQTYQVLTTNDKTLLPIPNANHTFQAKTGDLTIWNGCMDQILPWLLARI
ncbi:MAG: alpha/beta hydrolase [Erysipelotrichaceae bacterium]|nr:alpha/beta hydrolase [Erysipelotrichaceae bacterium]